MNAFSNNTKFLMILAIMLGAVIFFFGYIALGGTNIATTLNLAGVGTTLDDGLVGHWTFDGGDMQWQTTGAEVRDRSGIGNHGALIGGLSQQSSVSGVIGQALRFNQSASTEKLTVAYDASLHGFEAMTISAWVRIDDKSDFTHLVSEEFGAFRLYYDTNSNQGFAFEVNTDGSGYNYANARTGPSGWLEEGRWYHVTGVFEDGQQSKVYIDGVIPPFTYADAAPTGSIDNNAQPVLLGNNNADTAPLIGVLDDVRIYNRPLLSAEILQLYRQGATTKIATTPAPSGPTVTLGTGLIGHWTFDGSDMQWQTTGAEVRDRSGAGNHGEVLGGMTSQNVSDGVLSQGLSFDAFNDVIEIPYDSAYDVTDEVTVSLWFKKNSPTSYGDFIAKANDDRSVTDFSFYMSNGYFLRFYSPASTPTYVNSSTQFTGTDWYHVTATRSGTTVTYYVNGEVDSSFETSGAISTNAVPFRIGKSGDIGNGQTWDGALDDVRVYDRALSHDEIKQLYRQGATTKVGTTPAIEGASQNSSLVGHWTFDGPNMQWQTTGAEVRDISGQGNHGAIAGGLTNSSGIEGVLGQALDFDESTDDRVSIDDAMIQAAMPDPSVTVSAWVYWKGKVDSGIVGGTETHFEFNGTGQLRFRNRGNNGAVSGGVPQNQWVHVAGTYDEQSVTSRLYLNGTEIDNHVGSAGSKGEFETIGSSYPLDPASRVFDGYIDDVRIYNRALSQAELMELYRLGQ